MSKDLKTIFKILIFICIYGFGGIYAIMTLNPIIIIAAIIIPPIIYWSFTIWYIYYKD